MNFVTQLKRDGMYERMSDNSPQRQFAKDDSPPIAGN